MIHRVITITIRACASFAIQMEIMLFQDPLDCLHTQRRIGGTAAAAGTAQQRALGLRAAAPFVGYC